MTSIGFLLIVIPMILAIIDFNFKEIPLWARTILSGMVIIGSAFIIAGVSIWLFRVMP